MNNEQIDPVKGNILVVDDTLFNLQLLSTVLIQYGYKVQTASDGLMALTTVEMAPPDLILLDIDMPGMNGYEVCQHLKANTHSRDISVIFISALNEALDKVQAFAVGGVDYITKPFQIEEVLVRIENQLTLRRLQKRLQQTNDELERRVEERTAELSKTIDVLEEQILERKQAEAALQEYAERLRGLHKMDQALLAAQSSEAIAQAALRDIRQLVPCQRASVTLFDFETHEVVFLAVNVNNNVHFQVGERIPMSAFGDTTDLWLGRPYVLEDISMIDEPPVIYKHLLAQGMRSLINIPLISRDELIGSLNLAATTSDICNAEHMAIAHEVATQLAVAIVQTRLFEAEAQRRQEAEALRDIAAALNSTLNLDEVLERILANVGRVVPHDAAYIMLIEAGMAHVVRTRIYTGHEVEKKSLASTFVVAETPNLRQMASDGQPLVIPDTKAYPAWVDIPETRWVRSYAGLPICLDGKVIGFLNLVSATPGFFNAMHAERLWAFVDQAAVALKNARLHTETQHHAKKLAALNKASRAMASTLELATVMEQAMSEVKTLLEAEAASVLLRDPASQELVFATVAASYAEILTGMRLPLTAGIAGWVMQERQPVLVDDVQQDPRFYDRIDQVTGLTTHSLLAVPLEYKDEVIGVIEVINKARETFNQYDLEMLEALTSSAAIAIENARLYKDLQDRMQTLQETQAQLIHSEKMAALGRLVASIAHEINNPLQSVQTCLTLTREELEGSQRRDKLDRYLNIVEGEIDRISAIVRRMRDFYRPARREFQMTDLHAVLESVLELAGKQLQHSEVTVERAWAIDLPEIRANPDHLKQVFLNLALNAIDAMPEGGLLRIITTLDQMPVEHGQPALPAIRLEFCDTGEGMPPETLDHLFEPFFTTKKSGSGLGLSISYGIIEAHKGQITVTSQIGLGTTFTIFLPIEPPLRSDN